MTDAVWALVVSNAAAIFGGVFWLVRTISKLEAKVDTLGADVDGIAEFVGTKRALARKKERETER